MKYVVQGKFILAGHTVELLIVGWDMVFVLHSFDYKFPKALVYMSSFMLEESSLRSS